VGLRAGLFNVGRWSCAAIFLLSGCAGTTPQAAGARPTAEPLAPDVHFSQDTGALDGTIVDDSLRPVANASVRISLSKGDAPFSADTIPNAAGSFGFSLLTPGTYQVRVAAAGFSNATQFAEIRAGEIAKMTVHLINAPTREPYLVVYPRSGLLECDWAFLATSGPCPRSNLTFANSLMRFNITEGFTFVVVQTTWKGFSDSLRVDLDIDDARALSSTDWPLALYTGKAPLKYIMYPAQKFIPPPGGQLAGLGPPRPVPTHSFPMIQAVSWLGSFQREINQTAAPVCSNHPLGYCLGVGAALDLKYTNYASVFVNGRPPNIQTYSALPDG
jgi:hypothetical protein